MLLPFVPPPPLEAREARGRNQRRRGANLHRGICSRSPTVRGGGARRGAGGIGRGGSARPGARPGTPPRTARGRGLAWLGGVSDSEARPADSRAGEWAGCCHGRGRRGGTLPGTRAEGRDLARVGSAPGARPGRGEAGRRGRRGGTLPGLQAAGAGRWRYLDVGPWNLALFQQNVNTTASPSTHSLGIKPFGRECGTQTHPVARFSSCYHAHASFTPWNAFPVWQNPVSPSSRKTSLVSVQLCLPLAWDSLSQHLPIVDVFSKLSRAPDILFLSV